MKIEGNQYISAKPDVVWTALTDPNALATCLTGAHSVSGSLETGYDALIRKKVGFLDFSFNTHLSVTHVVPQKEITLDSPDRGSLAVKLEETPSGTRVHYEAEVNVGNRLGLLGNTAARQLGNTMSTQFFSRLNDRLGQSETSHARQVA